ncbi:MAG TPA: type II CAAX endopeptidase family protein [Jiangellales bacterium]|nr:type II CAAX endopeptidase family protein [Jiangellales bacterium]
MTAPPTRPRTAIDRAFDTVPDTPAPIRLARRHPLAAFVVLAYAMSWAVWVPGLVLGGGMPVLALGAFGPAAAAALVTVWTGGSLRDWIRPLWHWRVPLRFWAYALGLPALLFVTVNVVLAAVGEPVDTGRLGGALLAYAGTFVVVALVGGGQEEPGWRGFALDRFQAVHSPVVATLLLGLVWGGWHLPIYGAAAVGPLLFVFYYTWLWNRTRSLLLCVLLHGSFTAALDNLYLLDDGPAVDLAILGTLLGGVLVLLVLTRGRLGFPAGAR